MLAQGLSSSLEKHRAVLDSGCTHHTFKRAAVPINVPIDTSKIVNIQTAHTDTSIKSSGRANLGIFKDAIIVEDQKMPVSLASLPQFDRAGCETIIKNGKAVVSKNGKVLFTAALTDRNLYEFDSTPFLNGDSIFALLGSAPVVQNLDLWHRRLNHFNKRSICRAVNENLISGIQQSTIKKSKQDECLCDACARAKSTKYPKNSKTSASNIIAIRPNQLHSLENDEGDTTSDFESDADDKNKAEILLPSKHSTARDIAIARPLKNSISLICTDTKGPFRIAGLKGEIYYQCFIEKSTKYLRQFFHMYKSDCFSNLKNLIEFELSAEGSTYMLIKLMGLEN